MMELQPWLVSTYVCACIYVSTASNVSASHHYITHNETDSGIALVTARMKMSDFFHPAMLLPQLVFWGFAPILLANLKMFVMQALMLNKMALSSALYMTLRNIVFGPRPGSMVKYVNKGYNVHARTVR